MSIEQIDQSEVFQNPNVRLTPNALVYLKRILKGSPSSLGIRLGVKKSGCSGYAYVLDFAKSINEDDFVLSIENSQSESSSTEALQIIIDKNSLPFLKGIEIDCHEDDMQQAHLKFNNPNVKGECGCGESFSIK